MAACFHFLLGFLALSFSSILASDRTPLQDYCVADVNAPVLVNGVACKAAKMVQADDFVFSGLHMAGNTSNPSGSKRLNIMIDVALALEYLHHGQTAPVVHCDLKPSNILLYEDMVAHVSDFGIAKLLGEGQSITQTITLATIGYMAPEYGCEGVVSISCDIYSYGILLMETFTRKKPTDEMFDEK